MVCRQHALRFEEEFLEDMDSLGNLRPQVLHQQCQVIGHCPASACSLSACDTR